MKDLFNPADKQEIIQRINTLSVNSKPQWGKMSVAQMLKHNTLPMNMALTNPKPKRDLMAKIFGPLIKGAVIGPKPFKKNGFTPKEFKVDTQEVFDTKKTKGRTTFSSDCGRTSRGEGGEDVWGNLCQGAKRKSRGHVLEGLYRCKAAGQCIPGSDQS
jgi:hypothetical protein